MGWRSQRNGVEEPEEWGGGARGGARGMVEEPDGMREEPEGMREGPEGMGGMDQRQEPNKE